MKRKAVPLIRVFRSPQGGRRGRILGPGIDLVCALGWGGVKAAKREGDGGTPAGRFRVLTAFYRPDRLRRPLSFLPMRPLRPDMGWCDDPADRRYNRLVRLPVETRHEGMWRDDHLYDVVLDLSYNRGPIRRGRGSGIFLHLARPGFGATEGCVAVDRRAVARLVARIGPRTVIEVV